MKVSSGNTLSIGWSLYQKMLEDVKLRAPEEACGIVAGREGHASHVFVVTNASHSLVAFRMDPQEQVNAFLEMEREELEMLAVYHSHPSGPEMPSETDKAEFAYPGVLSLIWVPKDETWSCQAYLISDRLVEKVDLRLIDDE
jgi:proteasome lid subunit RPN8/RPN11